MGCDIHAFIEYRESNSRWWPFGSEFRLSRDYGVFASLAGVRGRGGDDSPVAAGRGVPDDLAHVSESANRLYVSEDEGEGNATLANAQRWIASGCSKPIIRDGKMNFVTHPDWHSHSWCTSAELKAAIESLGVERGTSPQYYAAIAAMEAFEKLGYETRLVFWFDN